MKNEVFDDLEKFGSRISSEIDAIGREAEEQPPSLEDLKVFLRWLHADEILVFGSDYPHWDWDNPDRVLRGVSPELRRRVFYDNARELYGDRLGVLDSASNGSA